MPTLDDFLPPRDGPAPAPVGKTLDDFLPPRQVDPANVPNAPVTSVAVASPAPSWLSRAGHYAADIGHSIEAGADKGIAGLIGAPADALGLIQEGYDRGQAYVQGRPIEAIRAESEAAAKNGSPGAWVHLPAPSRAQLAQFGSHGFEQQSQQRYEPETTAGKFAKTGAEFAAQGVAFPGSMATKAAAIPEGANFAQRLLRQRVTTAAPDLTKNVVKYGAAPGLASEAAGQLTEGTAAEPWARAGAALGTAGGLAVGTAMLRPNANKFVAGAAGNLSPVARAAALERFDTLMATATERGVDLPQGLAWDAATNGVSDMAGLYRHAEATGKLNEVNSRVAGQADAASRAMINDLGPAHAAPTQLGGEVAGAATAALDVSPQGRAVAQARRDTGPAVSPLQAGRTVETDLRSVRLSREAVRAEQAGVDAAGARSAPERFGMEGPTVTVERPGEPALQTIDTGGPAAPRYEPLPEGPATLASTAPVRPDVPAPRPAARGQTMAQFIAENGGIGLERGDIKAAGLDRWKARGVSNLVREDGLSIDNHWRERLIEEGYLPPDTAVGGGMQRNVHDEVIHALEEEVRGRPTRPYDWQGSEAADSFARQRDEFAHRASQAGADIGAELRAAGVDPRTVHPDIMDRATAAMVRDGNLHPLDAYEQAVVAAREPVPRGPTMREIPTTVTEEIPTVRFGQVDPRPAVQALARQLQTAKGDIRSTLTAALRDMRGPDGLLDMSVEGLRNARGRLDAAVQAAAASGDMEKAAQLTQARQALDRQLKQVPEQATADANFAANSRPLDPFSGNAPLGRVTAREGNLPSGRPVVPAEQVPSHLSGATAVEEALANGGPATRRALEQRRVTQILGEVTDARGNVSVERLRAAMRSDEHADVLAMMPDAQASLERIAAAQEGRDALSGTLVGRLAQRDQTTERAVNTLFPKGEALLSNMQGEVQGAVSALAQQNQTAARQLVRQYIEQTFKTASKDKFAGQNQMAGPKFRQALVGHEQDAANIAAAVRGLPGGETVANGMERLLDVLAAMGRRRGVGSNTSYNDVFIKEAGQGGVVGEAVDAALTGGLKLPTRIKDGLERWRLGRNLDEVARLLTDPDAVGAFRGLVAAGNKGGDIRGPLARLVAIGMRGAPIGGRIGGRGYRDAPLQISARPAQPEEDRRAAR